MTKGQFKITNAAGEVVASGTANFCKFLESDLGVGVAHPDPSFKEFCDHLEKQICAGIGVDLKLYRNKTEPDERSFAE